VPEYIIRSGAKTEPDNHAEMQCIPSGDKRSTCIVIYNND